jgi:hypothetical protein
VIRWVCTGCGVRVCNGAKPGAAPPGTFVAVRAGTLDDTSWLRPTAHFCTRGAQPWVALPDVGCVSKRVPPSLGCDPSRTTSADQTTDPISIALCAISRTPSRERRRGEAARVDQLRFRHAAHPGEVGVAQASFLACGALCAATQSGAPTLCGRSGEPRRRTDAC